MLKEYQSRKRYPSDSDGRAMDPGGKLAAPAKPRQREEGARTRSIREVLNTIQYPHSEWVSMGYKCCPTVSSPRVLPMTTCPMA